MGAVPTWHFFYLQRIQGVLDGDTGWSEGVRWDPPSGPHELQGSPELDQLPASVEVIGVEVNRVSANGGRRRGRLGGAANDTAIRAEINYLWLKHSEPMYTALSLNVHEARVLLTGTVETQEMRLDAVRLAWQATGVKEIINEIRIGDESGIASYASDTWISTQLKTKLLFNKNVSSINYTVETVDGTVYLMGIAQNQDELDRVTATARSLSNVRKVISYVRVKTEPGPRSDSNDSSGSSSGGNGTN